MREIKFRAFVAGKMFNVVDILFESDRIHIGDGGRMGFPLSSVEVMQYTGLKDKNGKEIYEGDVMAYIDGEDREFTTIIGYVNWEDNLAGFYIERQLGKRSSGCFSFKETVVIGNIYENPELLK